MDRRKPLIRVQIPADAFMLGRSETKVSLPADAFMLGRSETKVSLPADAFILYVNGRSGSVESQSAVACKRAR